jgi:ArsR family transcriptional regulator, arsenate/arsenite/antimonite-responsive transcriptional repressor / arsenate reductase (thioredoxin)
VRTYRELTARVTAFINLPFETMEAAQLSAALKAIGAMDGATAKTLAQAA